jgi:hypothetical protein
MYPGGIVLHGQKDAPEVAIELIVSCMARLCLGQRAAGMQFDIPRDLTVHNHGSLFAEYERGDLRLRFPRCKTKNGPAIATEAAAG